MTIQYKDAPELLNPSAWLDGTLESVPGGSVIRLSDGSVLSVQPDGTYQTRAAVGPWELCVLDTSVNVVRFAGTGLSFAVAVRGR